MEDKISIIVPVYNAELYLDRCISSLVNQKYKNVEIILVNDGSTDNSLSICERWKHQDCRIVVISIKNRGSATARNFGIAKSTGAFIAFVDADDYIKENMYIDLYEKMIKEKADIVCCTDIYQEEDGKVISISYCKNEIIYGKEALLLFFEFGIPGGACTKLFRAALIKHNNIKFDNDIVHGEDFLFVCKCLSYCKITVLINMPYYHYLKHAESICNTKRTDFDKAYLTNIMAVERVYPFICHSDNKTLNAYKAYYATKIISVIIEMVSKHYDVKCISEFQYKLRKEYPYLLKSKNVKIKLKIIGFLAIYCYKMLGVIYTVKNK